MLWFLDDGIFVCRLYDVIMVIVVCSRNVGFGMVMVLVMQGG